MHIYIYITHPAQPFLPRRQWRRREHTYRTYIYIYIYIKCDGNTADVGHCP